MAQEQTPNTMKPDAELKDGKIRPRSKVKVLFKNSKHHGVPFALSEVHPVLAKKLVEQGKAEITTQTKLTKEQMEANKKALQNKVKAKGRQPGVVKDDKFDDDDEEDLIDDKSDKGKGGAK